ncbi:hypothetical protein KSP40_PGU012416 [Platanthera guangdongensis]|uniref:Uncharacterized protein n=1 Tax=Platanthera guangdongensis TaxID=2320717 RepID=A0ABR2MLS7_9ASPA
MSTMMARSSTFGEIDGSSVGESLAGKVMKAALGGRTWGPWRKGDDGSSWWQDMGLVNEGEACTPNTKLTWFSILNILFEIADKIESATDILKAILRPVVDVVREVSWPPQDPEALKLMEEYPRLLVPNSLHRMKLAHSCRQLSRSLYCLRFMARSHSIILSDHLLCSMLLLLLYIKITLRLCSMLHLLLLYINIEEEVFGEVTGDGRETHLIRSGVKVHTEALEEEHQARALY